MKGFNWDPVWFGAMTTVIPAIGTVTPPVAVNLGVASNISNTPMAEVSRRASPFFATLIAARLPVTCIPVLSRGRSDALGVR